MNIRQKLIRVIDSEAQAISNIQVTDQFEKAVKLLQSCDGKVVATGIGKAGFIARKFAERLASTGTPAIYIHPAEAGHGDLGMFAEDDCIVAF